MGAGFPEDLLAPARRIAEIAVETRRTVAVAESCTGGLVAAVLTELPGSSAWFAGGAVSYSEEMKRRLLGVAPDTLSRCGAVSADTAAEMARGLFRVVSCTTAASVTGLAGPSGGTEDAPVGTVCMAWADVKSGERSRTVLLPGERSEIRRAAAREVLEGLAALLAE